MKTLTFLIFMALIPASQAETTLKFLYTFDRNFSQTLIADFSKQTSIKVDAVFVDQSEVRIKMLEFKNSSNLPDVVLITAELMQKIAEREAKR